MAQRAHSTRHAPVTITWFGHSAFSVRSPKGITVLIDPWLENPNAPPGAVSTTAADVILVTHGHGDHLGNTVAVAKRTGAHVYAIYEIAVYLEGQGVKNVHGLNKSGMASHKGLQFTMTHAEHSGGLEPGGPIISGGDPAGFIIRLEDGTAIYHAGDTGVFGDMQLIGHLYKPSIAMLPIGGAFTMGPLEAAYACKLLKPQHIIGMHYGTYPVLSGTPEELKRHLPESMRKKVAVLTPGVSMEIFDMLDELYFGNTLRTWAIACAIVITVTMVLSVAKRLLVRRLRKFAATTATDIDDLIVDLLGRTRFTFLLAIAVFTASHAIHQTQEVQDFVRTAIILILLLQGAVWGNGLIAYGIERTVKQKMDEDGASATTLAALGFVGKILLWTIVLLLALDNLGFDITALVAGLGVTGIAVALALQNVLGDLFASLSIVLDKPFVIGDFIVVDAIAGTVEHVGLKTTRIRSLSGEQIIISNADILKSRIRNFKRMQERRAVFTFGVEYQTPADKLERIPAIIREIIAGNEKARFDRAHLQSFGESSILFEVVYYVREPDYGVFMDTQQSISLSIVRKFADEGIVFAFPSRTVYVKQ